MLAKDARSSLPGKTVPYVLRAGEGVCSLVAGQILRLVAGVDETSGGFGAVACEATVDPVPVPLHYHEREHDTWFCTRGKLRLWSGNTSRILSEGDFAYVKPGDVHAFQCIAPHSQFFGSIAPGGWESFFAAAGEEWPAMAGLPLKDHPMDFAKIGRAMGQYRVMPTPEAKYADVSNGDETDRVLPDGPASYVLQAGYGRRRRLNGHLSTAVLPMVVSNGTLEMRTIEAGHGAQMPAVYHEKTHVLLYMLEGMVRLTMNGEDHLLSAGDTANIPAGVSYATKVESCNGRWLLNAANGNGLDFWDTLGKETDEYIAAGSCDVAASADQIRRMTGGDIQVAS